MEQILNLVKTPIKYYYNNNKVLFENFLIYNKNKIKKDIIIINKIII